VLAAALGLVCAGPAPANHGRSCGIVARGSGDYRVDARVISCRSAKTWVKRYLKRRAEPKGWSCVDPSGSIRVYCSKASKAYWATRL
jgi:hypothetical protein